MASAFQACAGVGVSFFPLAVETFGGWHPKAILHLTRIGRALARQTATPESLAIKHLFQRLAISLQKANASMLLSRQTHFPDRDLDGDWFVTAILTETTHYRICSTLLKPHSSSFLQTDRPSSMFPIVLSHSSVIPRQFLCDNSFMLSSKSNHLLFKKFYGCLDLLSLPMPFFYFQKKIISFNEKYFAVPCLLNPIIAYSFVFIMNITSDVLL